MISINKRVRTEYWLDGFPEELDLTFAEVAKRALTKESDTAIPIYRWKAGRSSPIFSSVFRLEKQIPGSANRFINPFFDVLGDSRLTRKELSFVAEGNLERYFRAIHGESLTVIDGNDNELIACSIVIAQMRLAILNRKIDEAIPAIRESIPLMADAVSSHHVLMRHRTSLLNSYLTMVQKLPTKVISAEVSPTRLDFLCVQEFLRKRDDYFRDIDSLRNMLAGELLRFRVEKESTRPLLL